MCIEYRVSLDARREQSALYRTYSIVYSYVNFNKLVGKYHCTHTCKVGKTPFLFEYRIFSTNYCITIICNTM